MAVFKGIDMMESKKCIAVERVLTSPVAVDDCKTGALPGFPLVVFNIRFQPEQQGQGIDHQREFGQDEVIFGHAKAVHVSWFTHRDRYDLFGCTAILI
jgi:hypothetical protein